MGHMTTYRYGDLCVDILLRREKTGDVSEYECLVRGFGHGNTAKRKTYWVIATSHAQASRVALQRYKNDKEVGNV